jgi:Flp pilus assembly protein TadG
MPNKAKTLFRDSAGAALIELALTLTMLTILMVGISDFGRYAYAAIEVANAAHTGAMYGAQSDIYACDSAGMTKAATIDAKDVTAMTVTTSGAATNCSAHTLCACSNTPQTISACSALSCTSPNRKIQYVKVNTSAIITPIFNYPGFPATLTVTGQAITRVEQ